MKKIIAHRGVPEFFHENTCQSYQKAVDFGADMIEFDIRKTSDGVLVAHHDPFILNNGKPFSINELTYSDLQVIASHQQFTIPSIEEIFATFNKDIGFDVEFKEEGCEERTISIIDKYACRNNCIFTSFNISIINKLRLNWPDLRSGLLIEDSKILDLIHKKSLHLLCPRKDIFISNHDFFSDWKCSETYIAVWTVDDPMLMEQMLKDQDVDYLITNKCHNALKIKHDLKV